MATLTVTGPSGAASTDAVVITVTASSVLAAPADLRATAAVGAVRLAWTDNAANEDGYIIERAGKRGEFLEIARVSAGLTTYLDSPPDRATNYSYRVRAFRSPEDSLITRTSLRFA